MSAPVHGGTTATVGVGDELELAGTSGSGSHSASQSPSSSYPPNADGGVNLSSFSAAASEAGKSLLVASSIAPGTPSLIPKIMNAPPISLSHGYYAPDHQEFVSHMSAVHHGGSFLMQQSIGLDHGDEGEYDHTGLDDDEGEYSGSREATSDEDCSDYMGPLKLFVGQIPKALEEPDIFPLFAKYGALEDVTIIRDKHTGQHRGCAFVTFLSRESADVCMEELHNQFTFPRGRRPLQIRPASEPGDLENKLFVGMLPHNIGELDVRDLFSPFGEISAVYVIRHNDGTKKGCAFVKYADKESAEAAIDSLHGKVTMEGAKRALIVKFADTRSQKRARHFHQARRDASFVAVDDAMIHALPSPSGSPYYMPSGLLTHIPGMYLGHATPPSMGINSPHTLAPAQYSPQGQHPAVYAPSHGGGTPSPPNFMYQQSSLYGMLPTVAPYTGPQGAMLKQKYSQHSPRPPQNMYAQNQPGMPEVINPRPREGPAGANLFIYHLPHDLTDADLATAFNPFGNVISAKVYVDRYTGESKGFGFVSYDSVIAAEHAIEQMNGFQIGSKRLKVQHKRVNHRPPMSGPIGHYPTSLMGNQEYQHPFEGSSEGEDTGGSRSTFHQDTDGLIGHFGNLRTAEGAGPGDYQG